MISCPKHNTQYTDEDITNGFIAKLYWIEDKAEEECSGVFHQEKAIQTKYSTMQPKETRLMYNEFLIL